MPAQAHGHGTPPRTAMGTKRFTRRPAAWLSRSFAGQQTIIDLVPASSLAARSPASCATTSGQHQPTHAEEGAHPRERRMPPLIRRSQPAALPGRPARRPCGGSSATPVKAPRRQRPRAVRGNARDSRRRAVAVRAGVRRTAAARPGHHRITAAHHGLPPIRSMSSPMLTPCRAAHAATCSLSTRSGRSRWATSARSDNPAVRSIWTTCCLVSCTATTELSLLCEIAVFILSSRPRHGADRSCSDPEEGPPKPRQRGPLVRWLPSRWAQ